ncbi:MAG: hypothetical protein LAO23_12570 [Acidobacteriia bacterium]|nr:hypothetical protein [Terriglobia bacterium]
MANPNDAIRVAILRHLYAIHQQEATAANAGLAINQLSEGLKKKGYDDRKVASNLDYLVLKGLVREIVEHPRIWTIPGTTESADAKTYTISHSGIEQVEADKSRGGMLLTFVKLALQPVAIVILNVIAGLVFFPFRLLTSVPAAIAICSSIALGWFGFHQGRRHFVIASIVIVLAGIAWAALGLFVVLGKPLYCYSSDTISPLKAEVLQIGSGKTLGHVFYITDPVRNSKIIKRIVQTLFHQIIFVERREDYGQHAILIPLKDAVIHTVSSTGSVSPAEELRLAYYGPTVEVNASPQKRNVTVAFGVLYVSIVRYVHKAIDKPGLPWQAVIYDPVEGSRSALYVSYLDVALSAAARGDLETAVDTLESAYEYAPSEIERARNRVLLAKVSSAILNGTAGEAQSLSFMNQAMQHWPAAHGAQPIAKANLSSPVEIWLYDECRRTFFQRQAEYPNWAGVLAFHSKPVRLDKEHKLTKDWTFSYFNESVADLPEESLISAESDQLMALVSTAEDTNVLQRNIAERYGSSPEVRRWLVNTLIADKHLLPSEPLSRAIAWAIQQLPEPWYTQYSKAWHLQQVLLSQLDERSTVEPLQKVRQIAEELGFLELVRVINEVSQVSTAKEIVLRVKDTGAAPNESWYRRTFLDWFAATVIVTSSKALADCKQAGPQCEQLLESAAYRVMRDRAGNGHLFAPGLVVVLTLAHISRQELDPNFKVIYKEATGAEIAQPFAQPVKALPKAREGTEHTVRPAD